MARAKTVYMIDNAQGPEADFLDEIHIKVLRVFLLAIYSHLY
jgi:hypothetical protein